MATRFTRRLIIVVNAADAAAANAHALNVDTGGDKTFHAGLSASGNAPATHYWCNWAMPVAHDTNIRSRLAALVASNRVRVFNANTTTPEEVLATLGLQRVKGVL